MELTTMITSLSVGLGLYLLYLIGMHSWLQVRQGYVAVLTNFGKASFADESRHLLKTLGPGLHFKWPWQEVRTVSVMEQMIELSGEEGGTTTMASDGTMLRLDSKLRFSPVETDLYDFLFSMTHPIDHIKGLFTCLLRNEIANFDYNDTNFVRIRGAAKGLSELAPGTTTGSYALIRRDRRRLNQRIQDFCRTEIGDRYGIRFEGVDLTDILPPDELTHALNGVINAQSEAEKIYTQTEAECEQRVMAAERGLDIAKAKGKAVEADIVTMVTMLANLQRNGTLASYLARRRAEVLGDAKVTYVRRSK